MKYVFGPVPSRRLGFSLGIDTIPYKTCNWNCVYCQLGRTSPLTHKRLEYFPRQEILAEVETVINDPNRSPIDWITFVGSGEPSLHIGLGWLIARMKSITKIPVAVITNGSMLYLPEVRSELSLADAVLPTLDAGSEKLYQRINRPHPQSTFERLVYGMISFRKQYKGHFWLEVMLVSGLNDNETALKDISTVIERIQPDEVHINIPDRPPSESWVHPPDEDTIARAQSILGRSTKVLHPAANTFTPTHRDEIADTILDVITRHPLREDDLIRTMSEFPEDQLHEVLNELIAAGKARIVERFGHRFLAAGSARFQE